MSKASTTAPKGRATRARNEEVGSGLFGPTMQWVAIAVLAIAVMAGIFYFGRDFRSNTGGGGHSGAPADVVTEVIATPTG